MIENNNTNNENRKITDGFTIRITNPLLYDRLHILSTEYSVPVELLTNIAVKRLLDDVDFIRSLRTGKWN